MRHLSAEQCGQIAKLVCAFRGDITWRDVTHLAEEVTGQRFTRQTLEKREEIRVAYEVTNSRGDTTKKKGNEKSKSVEVQALEKQIGALIAENEFLDKLNIQLKEQFVVWAENARKKGLTDADLNCPLVKVDRNASSG